MKIRTPFENLNGQKLLRVSTSGNSHSGRLKTVRTPINIQNIKTAVDQGWKLMSCSQCQELGQRAHLASDWLHENKGPIRSQVSSLTQLLTLTTTHKFPPQDSNRPHGDGGNPVCTSRRNGLGIAHTSFLRILHLDLHYHPYKPATRQQLQNVDYQGWKLLSCSQCQELG